MYLIFSGRDTVCPIANDGSNSRGVSGYIIVLLDTKPSDAQW